MAFKIERLIKNQKGKIIKAKDGFSSSFSVSLSDLKKFVIAPFFISWYKKDESKKVFPVLVQEMMELNPDNSIFKKLYPGSNPFFKHLEYLQYYISYDNKKISGRVASLIDKNYTEKNFESKIGIIGLFEAEDKETGEKLLKEAIFDLKQEGVKKIIGPMRFNASGEAGLLIDGFEYSPMPLEPYNPPYYKEVFDKFGTKENDWFAFLVDYKTAFSYIKRVNNFSLNGNSIEDSLKHEGITFRSVKIKDFDKEVRRIQKVYNQAWDTNEHPQFVKLSDEEFNFIANSLKVVAIEDLIFLVESEENKEENQKEILGISVAIPNINEVIEELSLKYYKEFVPSKSPFSLKDLRRDIRIFLELKRRLRKKDFQEARIFILGTLKKKAGIDAVLYQKTYNAGVELKMQKGSGSQIADINLNILNPLLKMGKISFTWRVYKLDI